MLFVYFTFENNKYSFGVSTSLLSRRLPSGLCYFEVYSDKNEAKERRECLQKLSSKEIRSIISDKKSKGFICEFDNELTVITIKPGVYNFISPITVKMNNLIIRGSKYTVIQGCHTIGGWESLGHGSFSAKTEYLADGLYINDEKYQMARYPKYNPSIRIFGGFSKDVTSPQKAKEWQNPVGAYIHAMHSHNWGGFSYEVTGKNENGELIYEGGWQNNRQMGMHSDFRYIENVREEMTLAGEWCFDKSEGRVYVITKDKQAPQNSEICVNSSFFIFKGCKNVKIESVTFRRAKRTFMLTREPLLRSDWTIYRGGAIYFTECTSCSVDLCTLHDIGTNGIFVDGKNRKINITRCHLKDLGASGICFVGKSKSVRSPLFEVGQTQSIKDIDPQKGPKSPDYPKECLVDNCLIEHVGIVEKQATGVEISMSMGISVINTTISDTSRAGINISEGTFGGHIIDGCDVFDTVKETGDHGSFNSWGRDRYWHVRDLSEDEIYKYSDLDCVKKNIIRNSRFRCDRGWDIDLDDGSSHYEIYNNLCLNGGIKLREGFNRYVHHNITVNNSIHLHVWYKNSGDVIKNNIVFTEYQPILMDNGYGRLIDCNILYSKSAKMAKKADPLSEITGMDEHSIIINCMFKNPKKCDYTVTNPQIKGFDSFPCEFGVRYAPLKRLAKAPEYPKINLSNRKKQSTIVEMFGLKLKNIETDGEMSAYATAGHNGVLVTDIDQFSDLSAKGILPSDVIISLNKKSINSLSDLEGITQKELLEGEIVVSRAQGRVTL